MQKQAPQMKDRTKLESQASIMLGPQVIMDRPANILSIWHTEEGVGKSGEVTSVDMSGNSFIGLDFSYILDFYLRSYNADDLPANAQLAWGRKYHGI